MLMTRTEIRRRALRAAFAVSLSMGALGCAGTVLVESDKPADDGPAATPSSDPVPTPPVIVADAGTPAVDAGQPIADAGPAPDADAEAAVDCSLAADPNACCDEHAWSWDAGCQAWGPPMPPAMGVA